MKHFFQYWMSIGMFFKALHFVFKHKMAWLFLFPLLFNFLLWYFGIYSSVALSNYIINYIEWLLPADNWPQWLTFLIVTFKWILRILFGVLLFLLVVYIGGFLILIVLSPVLSLAANKTDHILSNSTERFNFIDFLADVWRGILLSVRNMFFELFFSLLFLLSAFIPIIGWLAPLGLFMNTTYYYGFSMMDYTLEQKQFNYKQAIFYARNNRGLAIGCGTVYALCLAIPYVGVFLGGFVAIVSVVAAALAISEMERLNRYRNELLQNMVK